MERHKCDDCEKILGTKSNRNRHITEIHENETDNMLVAEKKVRHLEKPNLKTILEARLTLLKL